jgi:hypothetical protein
MALTALQLLRRAIDEPTEETYSMSQAYDHAKEMWAHYDSLVAKATHAPVLRRIGRV